MKKLFSILCSLLVMSSFSQTPSWGWARSAGSSDTDQAFSIATDAAGNVYITGWFISPTIMFGSTTLVNAVSTSFYGDVFVVKYDSNGNVVWARRAGGSTADCGSGITVDAAGNILVTGWFNSSSITFGSTTLNNSAARNHFVVKYDANGNVLWAKKAGPSGSTVGSTASAITTDAANNVYITGSYDATFTYGTNTLTNMGGSDLFFAKYDQSGNLIWAKTAGGTGNEYPSSIYSDASGNTCVTGQYNATFIYGTSTLTCAGNKDLFLSKYDALGNLIWVRNYGGTGDDTGVGVGIDGSGNVFVGGYFNNTIVVGTNTLTSAGSYDVLFMKFDVAGSVLFAKKEGGSGVDYANALSIDASGNTYMFGAFNGTVAFGTTTLISSAAEPLMLVKHNANGNCTYAMTVAGSSPYAVSKPVGNKFYVTGDYFGSPVTIGTTTLSNAGSFDLYVATIVENLSASTNQSNVSCNGLCNGSAIALPGGGQAPYTYTWMPGGQNTSSVSGLCAGIYTLTVKDASNTLVSSTLSITQPPVLTATASITQNSICNGNSTTLNGNASGGTGTISYNWIPGGPGATLTVSPASSTIYTLSVIDSNSCTATANISLTVHPLPVIIASTNNSIICGPPYQGTATINASGASTYTWNTSATSASISVSPSVTTTYTVNGTSAAGCTNTATFTQSVSACTSVLSIAAETSEISVYPNPFNSIFTVQLITNGIPAQIDVYNSIGQLVHSETTDKEKTEINLNQLPSGIYFVKINSTFTKLIKK